MDYMEQDVVQERVGIPVDLTRDEFVDYHKKVAKKFGTLRMQLPTVILFIIYLVVIGSYMTMDLAATGQVNWHLLLMMFITVVCGGLTLYLMPWRVKRTAITLYELGNVSGYYGEVSITPTHIIKDLGTDKVSIPLSERSMYFETDTFMAFSTLGENRTIILPRRCVTKGMAHAIRQVVFAPECRVVKRVTKRMNADKDEPIARRDWPTDPTPLCEVDITYEEAEVKKQLSDMNWKKYVQSLPFTTLLGLMLGAMFATAEESILVFLVTTLGVILGMLLLSMLNTAARAKQILISNDIHVTVTLTDRGVQSKGRNQQKAALLRWESIEKAIERPSSVDLIGAGQYIRVPKRCIDDVDRFIAMVDQYVKC